MSQKELLEGRDKQLKEKDAIIKRLRDLGKNFRAKFEASRKEVDELKGSLSSQVGGVCARGGRGAACVCAVLCAVEVFGYMCVYLLLCLGTAMYAHMVCCVYCLHVVVHDFVQYSTCTVHRCAYCVSVCW